MKGTQRASLQEHSCQVERFKKMPGIFRLTGISIFLAIILLSNRVACQDRIFDGTRHKIGFQCGFGDQNWKLGLIDLSIDVSYTYEVYFLQLQYYYSLLSKEYWGIDFLFQPQYNIVRLKIPDDSYFKENGFESGLNCGIVVRRNLLYNRLSVYALISSGPHYISNAPVRQANGFIFSDNVSLGVNYRINDKIYLDFRPGFRHVSNAGIRRPNGGINTHTYTAGLLIIL
ncbi:MAG: acyloxyacyl hydrolase [Bacteroidales bacterium]|nr:acyloxyacyl hydrolase [Bacteroidales bacterium]